MSEGDGSDAELTLHNDGESTVAGDAVEPVAIGSELGANHLHESTPRNSVGDSTVKGVPNIASPDE